MSGKGSKGATDEFPQPSQNAGAEPEAAKNRARYAKQCWDSLWWHAIDLSDEGAIADPNDHILVKTHTAVLRVHGAVLLKVLGHFANLTASLSTPCA